MKSQVYLITPFNHEDEDGDQLILENTFYSDVEKISFDLKIDLPKFNKSKLFTEL